MIDYSAYLVKRFLNDLLLSEKEAGEFEAEARLLLAVKLYEMDRVSTGVAPRLAGISREAFMFELARVGLSPLGQEPGELAGGLANASKSSVIPLIDPLRQGGIRLSDGVVRGAD